MHSQHVQDTALHALDQCFLTWDTFALRGTGSDVWKHCRLSQCGERIFTCMQQVEARDATSSNVQNSPSQQGIIQPKMSIMLTLENPTLDVLSDLIFRITLRGKCHYYSPWNRWRNGGSKLTLNSGKLASPSCSSDSLLKFTAMHWLVGLFYSPLD